MLMNTENQNIEFKESWGRGWQKICDGFMAAGLPKPSIESKQGGVLVTFQRNNVNLNTTVVEVQESTQKEGALDITPNKGIEEEKTTQKTQQKSVQESVQESSLKSGLKSSLESVEKTQQKSTLKNTLKSTPKSTLKGTLKRIVELIGDNPNITIDNVAELLQMNRRGIVKHFKNLQTQGIIRRVGLDKGGHWEIIGKNSNNTE